MTKKVYQSEVDLSKDPIKNFSKFVNIKNELENLGVNITEQKIDIKDFENWLKEFEPVDNQYKKLGDVYIEKCLEHYLSFKFLNFKKDDIFIDIAASGSVFANELVKRKLIKNSYLLDLAYKEGINENKIGADAADTKLPDCFTDKMSLQCAYECFEGTADTGYIKEASRILKPNGKFVITPLYIDDVYYNCTSHTCNQEEINFDEKALKVWRNDEYSVPFSRHYNSKSFYERIILNVPKNLSVKLFFFTNLPELMNHFRDQRIYCYFLMYGEKID